MEFEMKWSFGVLTAALLLTGCQTTSELEPVSQIKPGVASEGSLANHKLIEDTTSGIETITGISAADSKILKFVIQKPVGKVGSRSWRELWLVKSAESENHFLVTFKEAGLSGADFELELVKSTQ